MLTRQGVTTHQKLQVSKTAINLILPQIDGNLADLMLLSFMW